MVIVTVAPSGLTLGGDDAVISEVVKLTAEAPVRFEPTILTGVGASPWRIELMTDPDSDLIAVIVGPDGVPPSSTAISFDPA